MRVFIGVPLAEDLRDNIIKLQQLASTYVKMKAVERENLHWTVKFLGEVLDDKIQSIIEVLYSLKTSIKPFSINVTGLGVFPSPAKPRVLWVTASDGEPFVALVKMLDVALSKLGFPTETREVVPHLTIGRIKAVTDRRGFREFLEGVSKKKFGGMKVNSVTLYKSVLSEKGPTYSKLHEIYLGE